MSTPTIDFRRLAAQHVRRLLHKLAVARPLQPIVPIKERYRQLILAREDGSTRSDIVASDEPATLEPATLTILTGTSPKRLDITMKSIDDCIASPVSIMPNGVLDTLDKELVLDLLACLLAGDNSNDAAFKHYH